MIGPWMPTGVMPARQTMLSDAIDASRAIAARAEGARQGETAVRVDPPSPTGDAARLADGMVAEDGRRGDRPPAPPKAEVGPDAPAGPPPTFKITILERERLRAAEPPDPSQAPDADPVGRSDDADPVMMGDGPRDGAEADGTAARADRTDARDPAPARDPDRRTELDDATARAGAGFATARRILAPEG